MKETLKRLLLWESNLLEENKSDGIQTNSKIPPLFTLILIYQIQLFNIKKYYNKLIDKEIKTYFILIEDDYFFNKYKYHKMKLILHKSSMEYYYK